MSCSPLATPIVFIAESRSYPMGPIRDLRTPEEVGRDMLDRAQRPGGAITMEEAAHIHRSVGWPPPRLDGEGAIRAPTADELARWCSSDPAVVEGMEWPEMVEEIEHRAPAVGASLFASAQETVRALRARDQERAGGAIASAREVDDDGDGHDDAPVTDEEAAVWPCIGCALLEDPRTFRRVVAVLSSLGGAGVRR